MKLHVENAKYSPLFIIINMILSILSENIDKSLQYYHLTIRTHGHSTLLKIFHIKVFRYPKSSNPGAHDLYDY